MTDTWWARIRLTALGTFALMLGACSNWHPSGREGAPPTGSVSLPLTASANGHDYRLRNAGVSISGPASVTLNSTDDPAEMAPSSTLAAGNYAAYLYQYRLERDDGSGNVSTVKSQVINSNLAFTIFNGTTTTITFQFQPDGTPNRPMVGAMLLTRPKLRPA